MRARYYTPGMGRFLTKDTWDGDYSSPLTLNKWNYVNGNPINYVDPSGHISCKDVISSWRPIFTALRLCNPQEDATLAEEEIEFFESLDSTLNSGFINCGIGYVVYGYTCVPVTVEKTLGGYCGENTTGAFLARNKDDARDEQELQEKCEKYRHEYEATIREIKFRINLIRQYQNIMASSDDPEVRETMAGLILNTQFQADLFYAGARSLLFQAIEEGCNASLWSPLPILPWIQ